MEIITESELQVIVNALYTRYGLDFRNYESQSLRRRVTRIIEREQLGSIYGLWRKILYEPAFIQSFVNQIAVGLTELFRNPELWAYLRDEIIPNISQSSFKVWHAGCSTGEEIYSFKIMLEESSFIGELKGLATDNNTDFLEIAEKGEYPKDLLMKYDSNYQKFTSLSQVFSYYYYSNTNGFTFKPFLRNGYTFSQHNLTQDAHPKACDLVFCRNVLIYFDETLRLRVIKNIANSLKSNAYLILGYYDSLPQEANSYFEVISAKHKVYQKSIRQSL